jgi:hypothetical protein
MSEENEDIGAVAMALTIEANENTLGLAIRVRNEFDFIEDDLKVEFVTQLDSYVDMNLRRVLIAEKGDQTVMH